MIHCGLKNIFYFLFDWNRVPKLQSLYLSQLWVKSAVLSVQIIHGTGLSYWNSFLTGRSRCSVWIMATQRLYPELLWGNPPKLTNMSAYYHSRYETQTGIRNLQILFTLKQPRAGLIKVRAWLTWGSNWNLAFMGFVEGDNWRTWRNTMRIKGET